MAKAKQPPRILEDVPPSRRGEALDDKLSEADRELLRAVREDFDRYLAEGHPRSMAATFAKVRQLGVRIGDNSFRDFLNHKRDF
jgi:hypothetical protein